MEFPGPGRKAGDIRKLGERLFPRGASMVLDENTGKVIHEIGEIVDARRRRYRRTLHLA
jgi:hypothetical protein